MLTWNNTPTADAYLRTRLELLTDPPTSESAPTTTTRARGARRQRIEPAPTPSAHGYGPPAAVPLPDTARATPANPIDLEAHIHPELRAHPQLAPAASMMPATVASHPAPPSVAMAGPSSIVENSPPDAEMADDEPSADGRKAKRELSQSKRAAQNRAAQVSFPIFSLNCAWVNGSSSGDSSWASALWRWAHAVATEKTGCARSGTPPLSHLRDAFLGANCSLRCAAGRGAFL